MEMRPPSHDTINRNQRSPLLLHGSAAVLVGVFLLWISSLLLPESASATIIYSYIDERGTAVLTDNYETIPERYRAKVQATEHAPQVATNHSTAVQLQQSVSDWAQVARAQLGTFAPSISGLTPYQSHVLTVGGLVGVICLLARLFARSQAIRFLSLWCLVMLCLTVPALLFTSQDTALDLFTGRAVKAQEKQQDRLQNLP
jgi:hypothetical protein